MVRRQGPRPHYTFGYYRVSRPRRRRKVLGLYGFLAHNGGDEVATFPSALTSCPIARQRRKLGSLPPPPLELGEMTVLRRRGRWPARPEWPATAPHGPALRGDRHLADLNGTLSILPSAPRRWFEDGKKTSVSNAPTFYGKVSSRSNRTRRGRVEPA